MKKTHKSNFKQKNTSDKYCYFDGKHREYLTKRESQCFSWIVRAKPTKVIGSKLGISTKTVENYIDILKEKLGCNSKMELMGKAIRDGMTSTILSWAEDK